MYVDYATFLRRYFPFKVQKIGVNAGFTCPNRDGKLGAGGCTYCNNQTFSPDYCSPTQSVAEQLAAGKRFFAAKYPQMRYIAYFQAYTNSYGRIDDLARLYDEALAVEGVVGLIIGTRPDCVSDELFDYLQTLSQRTFLVVEYGVESSHDRTLQAINRGHDYATAVRAIEETARRGILCGAHLILGLPGESRADMIATAQSIAQLPINTLKLHQLQLIRNTRMAVEYEQNPERFNLFTPDEYIDLCLDFLKHLPDEIVIERFISQSPADLLIAPKWGLKNHEFVAKLHKKLHSQSHA